MAQFTNQAQLSYNNTVVNSNVVVGEILEVVSAAKTAVVDTYAADGAVTYAISIVNAGNTAISNLTVVDNLGAYQQGTETRTPLDYVDGSVRLFINGVLQPTPTGDVGSRADGQRHYPARKQRSGAALHRHRQRVCPAWRG